MSVETLDEWQGPDRIAVEADLLPEKQQFVPATLY